MNPWDPSILATPGASIDALLLALGLGWAAGFGALAITLTYRRPRL